MFESESPPVRQRATAQRQDMQLHIVCDFTLLFSFHLCSGTKETESRKGEEEKRSFRENRKEHPVENIGTNCSKLALLSALGALLWCFWAPLRLMNWDNSEETGAQTPPPNEQMKNELYSYKLAWLTPDGGGYSVIAIAVVFPIQECPLGRI